MRAVDGDRRLLVGAERLAEIVDQRAMRLEQQRDGVFLPLQPQRRFSAQR